MKPQSAPFAWPVRIYYEDTDCGGVVYYANYLRYLERARSEWLRSFGFEQDQLRAELGILFAVRSVSIQYHRAARFNEELSVTVVVDRVKRASMDLQQNIFRQQELLTSAAVNIVCLRENSFDPCPIPKPLIEKLP